MRKQEAQARYGIALEAANAEYLRAIAPVGGAMNASEADFFEVVVPAGQVWNHRVEAAYAAYQEEVR